MLSREALMGYGRIDSRGNPTPMARIRLSDNGRIIDVNALAPSGASIGKREALELRDKGAAYGGKGVSKAITNIGKIAEAIAGLRITDQSGIDYTMKELDGTDNKRVLGANAMVAVSLAAAKAAAEYTRQPLFKYFAEIGQTPLDELPTPLINVVNGGVHASNGLAFQEFMIVPVGARNFSQAMHMGMEVYAALGKHTNHSGVGDEGGYSPNFGPLHNDPQSRVHRVLEMLVSATKEAYYEPGKDIALALDVAASEFFDEGAYRLDDRTQLTSAEMNDFYAELIGQYPIISIEDGMAEGDVEGWKLLTESQGGIQLVGDDLFVTNPRIFRQGISDGIANAILVKVNQIGTVTETLQVMRMARENQYRTIVSHRSGETEDTSIVHLAVGTGAGQIKTGAPARGERTVKYNELLNIEQIYLPEMGITPRYAGNLPFKR